MKLITDQVTTGRWDSFRKSLIKLDFLPFLNISQGVLRAQVSSNNFLEVDFTSLISKIDLSMLVTPSELKELSIIHTDNGNISLYETDTDYIFTNNVESVSLCKYPKSKDIMLPDYVDRQKTIGTKLMIGVSELTNNTKDTNKNKVNNKSKEAEIMFRATKNKGPLDFIIVNDELIGIVNKHGSRINFIKDIIKSTPTDVFRSFDFDKFDGLTVILNLLKVDKDPECPGNMSSTWLDAEITIDTIIKLHFYERLSPITKHNWRY